MPSPMAPTSTTTPTPIAIRKPQPMESMLFLLRMSSLVDVCGGIAGARASLLELNARDVYPEAMKLTRTVALVGMMGAGKSSIGRRLAARLNVPFKGADSEIESAAGCSISEIFE